MVNYEAAIGNSNHYPLENLKPKWAQEMDYRDLDENGLRRDRPRSLEDLEESETSSTTTEDLTELLKYDQE